jgi:hypothetical protein
MSHGSVGGRGDRGGVHTGVSPFLRELPFLLLVDTRVHRGTHACTHMHCAQACTCMHIHTHTHTHTHTECPSCDLPREWPSLRLGVSVLGLSLLGALSHREPLGCRARPPAGSQGHMGLGFEL